jgi:hypothetical protein
MRARGQRGSGDEASALEHYSREAPNTEAERRACEIRLLRPGNMVDPKYTLGALVPKSYLG